MRILLVMIRTTGSSSTACDLRLAGMFASQCSIQGDTAARYLRTNCVRLSEWGIDVDCSSASKPGDGSDDRRFRVRTAANGNGLAVAETRCPGNRDDGCANSGCSADCCRTGRAYSCNHSRFSVGTRIDADGLT